MPDSPRPKRPRVIVTRQLMPHVEARMAELFEVVLSAHDRAFSDGELKAAMQDCDVLVPTVTDRIDADIVAAAGERLKLIAHFGAGVDHIDLAAASARGIMDRKRVVYVKSVSVRVDLGSRRHLKNKNQVTHNHILQI